MKIENDINEKLQDKIKTDIDKIEKAKKEKNSLIAQTVYLGTLGIIFILPVIVGGYVGVWLDNKLKGFSISWTISLLFLGIIIGIINVYYFLKE